MKVLFLAAEATPFIKVGGLGDVAGTLPKALRELGVDVRLCVPRYYKIDPHKHQLKTLVEYAHLEYAWVHEGFQVLSTPDEKTWFIENERFFGSRTDAYGYSDDGERFVSFARAALQTCAHLGWYPDVIHAHDWHSAAAVRIHWASKSRAGLVFTIHNLAHQGLLASSQWPLLGVYDGRDHLNLMEQAIWSSDVITTVSPTYAKEILTPDFSFGLDGILRQRQHRLVGILNGLDQEEFNPETDPDIAENYKAGYIGGKGNCKLELQKRFGLEPNLQKPLLGLVSRLDGQKGISLALDSVDSIMAWTNAQIFFLGSGNSDYEKRIQKLSWKYPGRVANFIGFQTVLARQVYAASDMFLMPSKFEPCGLSQLIAMRYGALPIVRHTGGLADTVLDCSYPEGRGFVFSDYSAGAFRQAVSRAFDAYWNRDRWKGAMYRAMTYDSSWYQAAVKYTQVYEWARSCGTRW